MNVLKMTYEETDEDGRETLRVTRTISGYDLDAARDVNHLIVAAYRDLRNCVKTHKLMDRAPLESGH